MSQGHSNEAVEEDAENGLSFVVNIETPDPTESRNDVERPSLLKSVSSPGKAVRTNRFKGNCC